MTRGQGIRKAIILIESLKGFAKVSKNPNAESELNEIIEHLEFVGRFYR